MLTEHKPGEEQTTQRRVRRIMGTSLLIFVGLLVLGAALLPRDFLAKSGNIFKLLPLPSQNPVPAGFVPVKNVVDGDTVEVWRDGRAVRVRLIGIDTPEVVDPRKVVQCFGREASIEAHKVLEGKNVRLELDPTQGETDKYGRLLAYLFTPDGQNYNQYMIEQGFAHEYTYQSQPYKYQSQFKQAEQNARAQQRGLWSDSSCGGNTKQPAR